jgi:hypothetical protein
MNHTHFLAGAMAALLITLATTAAAQGQSSGGGGGQRRAPPPEAVAACNGKAAGDTVTFTGRRGTMTGVCEEIGGVLAARPVRGSQGGANPPGDR